MTEMNTTNALNVLNVRTKENHSVDSGPFSHYDSQDDLKIPIPHQTVPVKKSTYQGNSCIDLTRNVRSANKTTGRNVLCVAGDMLSKPLSKPLVSEDAHYPLPSYQY